MTVLAVLFNKLHDYNSEKRGGVLNDIWIHLFS